MKNRKTTTSGLDWNVMLGLCSRLLQDGLYREYLLVMIGCHFGLRISDLLKIKYSDIVGKTELILIEQKTGKQRKITINPRVSEAVNIVVERRKKIGKFGNEDYIFANRWGNIMSITFVNRRLSYIFSRYQVKVQNPSSHTLRKSFGMQVWLVGNKSDAALVYLSEIYSHSSTRVTRKYIGISEQVIADVYLSL
jgi:site-specific recombinase XerD